MGKRFFFFIKITLSIFLIFYVLQRIQLTSVINELTNINLPFLIGACGVLLLQFWIAAYRWNVTLISLGTRAPWKTILRINWTALFFNQALPASIGGDATRVWFLHQRGHAAATTISSILIGHLGMITGLLMISFAGIGIRIFMQEPFSPGLAFLYWFIPLLLIGACVLTMILARFGLLLPKPIPAFTHHLRLMLHRPTQVLFFMLLTIVSCFLLVIVSYLLGVALHLPIAWMNFVTLMPLVIFASVLPISIGGWGPREATTIALFSQLGISNSAAFTLSVLLAICTIVVSLPGALFYLFGRH